MVNKERLIIIPPCANTLEEDIIPQQVNMDMECEVVYKDDNYTVYKPLSDSGLILLSAGTKWLGERGYVNNKYTRGEVDDVNDNNWHLQNWDRTLVLVDNKSQNSNKPRKWLYYVGYGQGEVPSGAEYPMANIVYDTGDKDLWRWFINQNYPYVSTNLKKKVGSQLLDKSKTELVYPDDFTGDYDNKNITYAAKTTSGITKIIIKPGTTLITTRAFAGYPIESIEIPEGVKTIRNGAFAGCSKLTSVTLPNSLTKLGNAVFQGCPLKTITIPAGLKEIPDYTFGAGWGRLESGVWGRTGTALTEIDIPGNITRIGDYAFDGQVNLKKVILNEGLKIIGMGAFSNCESLKKIDIPHSVETLNYHCFIRSSIKRLFIPANVTRVGSGILASGRGWDNSPNRNPDVTIYCEVESKPIGWDTSWDTIDSESNYSNMAGRYITTQYKARVIWGASGIGNVSEDLQPTIVSRGKPLYKDDRFEVYQPQTFDELVDLSQDTDWKFADVNYNRDSDDWRYRRMSDDDMSRKYYIFVDNESGHKYIYNPISFRVKDTGWGNLFNEDNYEWKPDPESGFRTKYWYKNGADLLERFLMQEGTFGLQKWAAKKWPQGLKEVRAYIKYKELYEKTNGVVVYNSDLYKAIHETSWYEDIPERNLVRGCDIGGKEFTEEVKVQIPRNTRRIQENAFYDWKALKSINIPNTVTYIADSAFSCSGLQEINLSDNLEGIGNSAFSSCPLKYIFIPKSVKYIGVAAFALHGNAPGCKICCEVKEKPENWSSQWLGYVDDSNKITVYWGCKKGEIPN